VSNRSTDAIDQQREESVNRIVTALHDLLERLRNRQAGCSFECSSILLGALTIQMHGAGILEPRPKPPYLGYSYAVTMEMARGFRSPEWCSIEGGRRRSHICSLTSLIKPVMESMEGSMEGSMGGLMLWDFPNT
jgi:hypothetical protein